MKRSVLRWAEVYGLTLEDCELAIWLDAEMQKLRESTAQKEESSGRRAD